MSARGISSLFSASLSIAAVLITRSTVPADALSQFDAATITVGLAGTLLIIFIHELGHALALVRLTDQRARVYMGIDKNALGFGVGRIDFAFSIPLVPGRTEMNMSELTPRQLIQIALAGPLASVLFGLALAAAALAVWNESSYLCWVLTLGAGLSALAGGIGNAIPFNALPVIGKRLRPGNDGSLALWAMRCHLSSYKTLALPLLGRHFSAPARRAMFATEPVRKRTRAHECRTEHLLVGLLHVTDGTAARLLAQFGVTVERADAALAVADTKPPRWLPLSRRSNTALFRAHALRGDGPWIGTEHLLAALLEDPDSSAPNLLTKLGASPADVRQAAVDAIAEQPAEPTLAAA